MKPRRLYYRRKDKMIVIEGKKSTNRTEYIWTLPDPETLIKGIIDKVPFFTQEKQDKILEKIKRLAFQSETDIES